MRRQVKIHFYLLASKKKSDGTLPIYVRLSFFEEHLLFSAGLSVHQREWNKKMRRMKGDSKRSLTINQTLFNIETEIIGITNKLHESGRVFTVREIKEAYLRKGEESKIYSVHDCFEYHLNHLRTLEGKEYTAGIPQD